MAAVDSLVSWLHHRGRSDVAAKEPSVKIDMSKARWRKSSLSLAGNCVEVAFVDDLVAVRDSKNPAGTLVFSASEWAAFIGGVQAGEFDRG
jgi:hypothetical protein